MKFHEISAEITIGIASSRAARRAPRRHHIS